MGEQLERYRWLIVAGFAAVMLAAVFYLIADRTSDPAPVEVKTGEAPADIRVYVTGAVRNPGVYPLPDGSRWIDAVEAAGGGSEDADLTAVNLARRVKDEDQIVVPARAQSGAQRASQTALVNINTAGQAELESLPGIGEVRAGQIVQSRQSAGAFATIEELVSRKLVSQSVFDDIAPLITIN